MTPERHKRIKSKLVEEYCWTGKYVVYINGRLTTKKYDEITADNIDEFIPLPVPALPVGE